jgi:glycosyltransferase involved in cell wall biosynthesis
MSITTPDPEDTFAGPVDFDVDISTAAALSPEAYRTMLGALRDHAKREAVRLNLDWAALMEQAPEQHSAAKQALMLLQLGLFDEAWYLATYSDVKAAGFEPIVHYVNLGDAEGRRPNAYFDAGFYRAQLGGTELRSVCALYHYALIGEPLGLTASRTFSPHRYLVSNTALQAWLDKPLTHFLHLGKRGGLTANHRSRLSSSDKVRFEKTGAPPSPGIVDLAAGINVIGPLDRVSGLGVSARGYLDGLRRAGLTNLGCRAQQREFAIQTSIADSPAFPAYLPDAKVNLVHMNGDTLPVMIKAHGDHFLRGKYNIAVWYWELPTLRPEWQALMKHFHEFWAPTPFIERALRQSTDKPVRLVPPYLAYLAELKSGVQEDTNHSHFVYCFDANSILERKNPTVLLDAFLQVFPPSDGSARLTFKVTYPNRKLAEVDRLYEAAANDSRIQVIDRMMSDADLHALIGSATAYVSPHRSEGLGLTVVEAMAAGVPVISTPFGGVDQFVTADAAFPVEYCHTELEGDYWPYPRGYVWAEPDVISLGKQLSLVHRHRDIALRRAKVARQRVLDTFCSSSLVARYRSELANITAVVNSDWLRPIANSIQVGT